MSDFVLDHTSYGSANILIRETDVTGQHSYKHLKDLKWRKRGKYNPIESGWFLDPWWTDTRFRNKREQVHLIHRDGENSDYQWVFVDELLAINMIA